jgi:glutamyl-tRNA synthetase
VIKERMKTGFYTGWDDVRLPTVRAFLRRGFHPKTFEVLAKTCGLTKTDVILGVENIEGINRKIIDPLANRYMVVISPVRISVNLPDARRIFLDRHPDFPERGKKTIPVNPDEIYISGADYKEFKNKIFRLIGMGNVKLKGRGAEYKGNGIIRDMQKIQWVSSPNIRVKILSQKGELKGLGEPEMKKLKTGDIIQMNRIGFGRVDSKGKEIVIAFAHK